MLSTTLSIINRLALDCTSTDTDRKDIIRDLLQKVFISKDGNLHKDLITMVNEKSAMQIEVVGDECWCVAKLVTKNGYIQFN